jgi:hypothetical protein
MKRPRIFLLSPANCSGERARRLLSSTARGALAQRLRSTEGAPLGEVFAFLSALYFRGKLTYACTFAKIPADAPPHLGGGVLVITTAAGLLPAGSTCGVESLRAFAAVDLHPANQAYRGPLLASARAVDETLGSSAEVVLLGSVATAKYVEPLVEVFGERLLFPPSFVGRGDMSRGGLLLRSARAGEELDYAPVAGAVRHGPRPPKLPKLRR